MNAELARRAAEPFRGGARALVIALACAAAGAVVTALGFVLDARQAFFSYLTAVVYVVSTALGALVFLMIVNAIRARWPVVLRRVNEAAAATVVVGLVLFVPIVFGLSRLYPWTAPDAIADEHDRELVLAKLAYLNPRFFILRAFAYFVVWSVIALALRAWSHRQDRAPDGALGGTVALSGLALPAVALTLTFAAIDWIMSLAPAWFSTMFGIYWFAGGFLAALALLTIAAARARAAGVLPVSPSHYYALGRLLLAFVVFWAYIAYFQYMLIWLADKPVEASWFVTRARAPWTVASWALVIGHFVVPFFALLPYAPKHNGRYLTIVSVWLLAVHYIDMHWLVQPAARAGGFWFHWCDFGALAFVGGLAVAFGVWLLRGHPLVPKNDPLLEHAVRYESP
jgi:hypothetical protein